MWSRWQRGDHLSGRGALARLLPRRGRCHRLQVAGIGTKVLRDGNGENCRMPSGKKWIPSTASLSLSGRACNSSTVNGVSSKILLRPHSLHSLTIFWGSPSVAILLMAKDLLNRSDLQQSPSLAAQHTELRSWHRKHFETPFHYRARRRRPGRPTDSRPRARPKDGILSGFPNARAQHLEQTHQTTSH